MKQTPFYTHGGLFHCDEAAGYVIGLMAGVVDTFVRLTDITNIPSDGIVGDIGREYDPKRGRFDHHQGLIRDEERYPMATAGLMWLQYGEGICEGYCSAGIPAYLVAKRVRETLIRGIDAHDADSEYKLTATCSGGPVRPLTISHIVAGMNGPDVKDAEDQDARFWEACRFLYRIIESHTQSAVGFVAAQFNFDEVAEYDENCMAVTLKWYVPWHEIVAERYPQALFVIAPSNHPGSPFSLTAVPTEPGSRELKCPIERPKWFDGFIHQGRFIAGCASEEEALRLAHFNALSWILKERPKQKKHDF